MTAAALSLGAGLAHHPRARRGEIGFKALKAQVDKRLGKVQADWATLPEVQQAIGGLYAEFGPDGFEAAHGALLQAVAGNSGQGRVAIQAIELLANIEASLKSKFDKAMREVARLVERRKVLEMQTPEHKTKHGQEMAAWLDGFYIGGSEAARRGRPPAGSQSPPAHR